MQGSSLRHLALCLIWAAAATAAGAEEQRIQLDQMTEARPFLRKAPPAYRNFAFQQYTHYPNHEFPFDDAPRDYYNSLGNYLITGYPIFGWSETRTDGLEYGSRIYKDLGVWSAVFDYVVVGRDGYGSWGYRAIAGDGMIARFTPLTLSKTDYNGVRLDVSTPRLKFTGLASRVERPRSYIEYQPIWIDEDAHRADDSTLLLGSRMQADLGILQLGLNWVNQHVYQSTQPGNGLKGRLRPDQPLIHRIIVRFSDDSPEDDIGGAVVQDVHLIVNGEPRPDLEPQVIRHLAGVTPQVGAVSQATGRFRQANYVRPAPGGPVDQGRFVGNLFYRDQEIPLYSDYYYRLDYEAGIDVSTTTNLSGLVGSFAVESPHGTLQAIGDEQLAFLFDLSQEPMVESVEVEAILGNDYRVDVAVLSLTDPRGRTYHAQYLSTYYRTVLRSPGNVRDRSNLKRRRFKVGENTANFVYSADLQLRLPGLEVIGEYARSSVYSRYPSQVEGAPFLDDGARFADRGDAYYLNASHWFGQGRIGGEYFSINPEFQTEMRTYLDFGLGLSYSNLHGLTNETAYWQTVQDNDDGDRYPDRRFGNIVGLPNDSRDFDMDGIFLGQDEDRDGAPETNRNLNHIPDFDEPFLMYDVEPNIYAYGLDRNNNNEPDHREDDGVVDYPYYYDERGYHLFGEWNLSRHWSLGAGSFRIDQVAGNGRNNSNYALISYRREGLDRRESAARLSRLFFENRFRRVQDDIANEFTTVEDIPLRGGGFGGRGVNFTHFTADAPPIWSSRFRPDLLSFQDSYVNDTYLEGNLSPWSTLNVVQKWRLQLNWQQGGQLRPGIFQRERRLDFWTWVSRVDYSWYWGKLRVTPQYKFMLLRLADREQNEDLQAETRSIPILGMEYPLLDRTTLRAGIQGMGPLPYRRNDQISDRNSQERRTSFVTLTNRSRYFGYDLYTIVGVSKDQLDFDAKIQRFREYETWSFFVRTLIGYTEYGRPL